MKSAIYALSVNIGQVLRALTLRRVDPASMYADLPQAILAFAVLAMSGLVS